MAKNTKAKTARKSRQKTAVELGKPLDADQSLALRAKPRGKLSKKGAPKRRSMTETERKAIEKQIAPLKTRSLVPVDVAMDELGIKVDRKTNHVTPIDTCVSVLIEAGERQYNAPTAMVHIEEYTTELSKLPDTTDAMKEMYSNTVKGKELLAEIEKVKGINPFRLLKVQRLFDKAVSLLLRTRKLIAKRTEAELNGFIVNVQPGSPHVEVLTVHGQESGKYTLDNFQECDFVGARSLADLKVAPHKRAARGSKRKAGSQAGSGNAQGQAADKSPPASVPVGFASVPKTLALLATSVEKTFAADSKARDAMSLEDKNKMAVNLPHLFEVFTKADCIKSVELRGYLSGIVVQLMSMLDVTTFEAAKKASVRDNDAPKDTDAPNANAA